MKPLQLKGMVFGEWTVVSPVPVPKGKNSKWLCRCSCGEESVVVGSALTRGRSTSCGHANRPRLEGRTFGELTVVAEAGADKHGNRKWRCLCSCGRESVVTTRSLVSENTKSCGHLSVGFPVHGGTKDREYAIWTNMIQRCHNPSNPKFSTYGGRGIEVHPEWRHDYAAFLRSVGRRPSDKHQIDRIDNSKGYEPGNCRWVTAKKNSRNRRSNRFIEHGGETATVAEWAERAGVNYGTMIDRLRRGWTPSEAIAGTRGMK